MSKNTGYVLGSLLWLGGIVLTAPPYNSAETKWAGSVLMFVAGGIYFYPRGKNENRERTASNRVVGTPDEPGV